MNEEGFARSANPNVMPRSAAAAAEFSLMATRLSVETGHYRMLGIRSLMHMSALLAERAIRPFAVGRKNFLFSDTPRGARASAGMYSVVTTAKMNGVRPFEYLAWVLTEMPKRASEMGDPAVLESFMPWSPDLPAECRMGAAEASRAAEMPDEPLLDVDPELLDEEFAG